MTSPSDFHEVVFDAVPAPMLIVDRDLCVIDFNVAAARLSEPMLMSALRPASGDVLHCVETQRGTCGEAAACRECMIRKSVCEAYAGGQVHRRAVRLNVENQGAQKQVEFLVTSAPFRDRTNRLALLILEDLGEIDAVRQQRWVEAPCPARPLTTA